MPDYSKTVLYKIQHNQIECLLYVGQTTNFINRRSKHKSNFYNPDKYKIKLYEVMRRHGMWDSYKIEIIKKYPCNSRSEAVEEELKIIKELGASLNVEPSNTDKRKQERDWYMNSEYRKRKNERRKKDIITCECGCVLRKDCLVPHKNTNRHIENLKEKNKNFDNIKMIMK